MYTLKLPRTTVLLVTRNIRGNINRGETYRQTCQEAIDNGMMDSCHGTMTASCQLADPKAVAAAFGIEERQIQDVQPTHIVAKELWELDREWYCRDNA
jgi:hypothetical protein